MKFDNFKQWLEMSMVALKKIGDWTPEIGSNAYNNRRSPRKGYYKDDFALLTNTTALEKIKRRWSKCKEPFNATLLRSKEGARYRELGEVDVEFLKSKLKLSDEDIKDINRPDTINIIYTNNMGAERRFMNWWTMAHRVGHAIRRMPQYQEYMKTVDHEIYLLLYNLFNYQRKPNYERPNKNEKMFMGLANEICTFASARNKKILRPGELYHELLAQYIIQGGVKFNHLPKSIIVGYTYGRPNRYSLGGIDPDEMEGWNDFLDEHLPDTINSYISRALDPCIGKIFVM